MDELLRAIGAATGRTLVCVPVPRQLAKAAIERVPGVYRTLRVPASALDYFDLPTRYGSANTQADLRGTGIAAPPFSSYLGRLVEFMRRNPAVTSAAMA